MERKDVKNLVIKKGVSFDSAIYDKIAAIADEKHNGNFSRAVNKILKDYLEYLSNRKRTIAAMERERRNQQRNLEHFAPLDEFTA